MLYVEIENGTMVSIHALAVILIIISVIKVLSELSQFVSGCCKPCRDDRLKDWWLYFDYLSDFSNWFELPLYILTMIFASFQLNNECTCTHSWQWSIGIAALFLAWATLILFLRKLELFGKCNIIMSII